MPIAAQWSLDTTADSAIAISRGIIQASTTDDVHPLALQACEKFGATLAMSQETCAKILHVVVPTPPPTVLKFMRGVVGYLANDCATHLGSSQAGVQFLGLATAFVATMSLTDGASALSLMLARSATDKQLLPTGPQLKRLLTSLEPRCHKAGFATEVAGWHMLLHKLTRAENDSQLDAAQLRDYPSAEAIATAVDAFRQLRRVGESSVVRVAFTVNDSAAWLIAFTKWCLGNAPSVHLDDGTKLLEQPASDVVIIVEIQRSVERKGLRASIYHSIGGPQELIAAPSTNQWSGMVSIETYGRLRLQALGLSSEAGFKAVKRSLPCAVRRVLDIIRFTPGSRKNMTLETTIDENNVVNVRSLFFYIGPEFPMAVTREERERKTRPLPSDAAIDAAICRMISSADAQSIQDLSHWQPLNEIMEVELFLKSLHKNGVCVHCGKVQGTPGGDTGLLSTIFGMRQTVPRPKSNVAESSTSIICYECNTMAFRRSIALLTADVLAASLFLNLDSVKFSLLAISNDRWGVDFAEHIREMIDSCTSDHVDCAIHRLVDWMLIMVGHSVAPSESRHGDWAMSSFKGQTIYPILFDTERIVRQGFLCLLCHEGSLRLQGHQYTQVFSRSNGMRDDSDRLGSPVVATDLIPANLYPDTIMKWETIQNDDFLELQLKLVNPKAKESSHSFGPSRIFESLCYAVVVENCSHDPYSALQAQDLAILYADLMHRTELPVKRSLRTVNEKKWE
ncbi:hypothetical protein NQ176_g2068 [Zarea fungicola]|uniref:Uncharacterized protein n=1 Tax=Zarea fungicola TaxID=93591 RepID=A0ACC1NR78_9HYPO|nr:hypothetical protein NQ176_g2068 [Lecanicillium fungicola]